MAAPNSEPSAACESGHVNGMQVVAVSCFLAAFIFCAFRVRRRGPASPAVSVVSEPASTIAEGSDQGPTSASDRFARPSVPLVTPVVQTELSSAPLPTRGTVRDRPLTIRVIGVGTDTGISLRSVGLSDPSADAPLRTRPLLHPPLVAIAEPRDEPPSIQLSPPPSDLATWHPIAPAQPQTSATGTLTPAYPIFDHSERYSPRVAQSMGQLGHTVKSAHGENDVTTAGVVALGAAAIAIDVPVGMSDASDSPPAAPATASQVDLPKGRSAAQPPSRRGVTPWRAMLHAPPRTSPALSSLGLKAVDGRADVASAGATVLPVPAAGSTSMVTARSAAAESAFSLDSTRSPGAGPRTLWGSSGVEDAPLAFSALHTLDEERGEDAPLPDADDVMEADSTAHQSVPSCMAAEVALPQRIVGGDISSTAPLAPSLPVADPSRTPHIVTEAAPVQEPGVPALLVSLHPACVASHNAPTEPDISQDARAVAVLPVSRAPLLIDASDQISTDTRAIPDAPIERPLFEALQTVPASAGSLSTSRGVFSPPTAPESSARGLISASEVSVRMHLPTSSSSRLDTATLSPRLASQSSPSRLASQPPPSRQWSPAHAPAPATWEHDRRGVGTSVTAAIADGPRAAADRAALERAMAALVAWEQGLPVGQHRCDRVEGRAEADAARPPQLDVCVGGFRGADADGRGDLWPEYRPLTVPPPLGYHGAEALRADDGGDDEEQALSLLQRLRAEARDSDDGAPPSGIGPRHVTTRAGTNGQRQLQIESLTQSPQDSLSFTLAQSLRSPPSSATQRSLQRAISPDAPHPAARPTVLSSPSTTSVAGYYRSDTVDRMHRGPLSPQGGLARAPAPSLLAAAATMGIAPANGGAQAAWVSPTRRPHEREAWAGVQVRGGGLGDFSIRKAASSGALIGSRSRL